MRWVVGIALLLALNGCSKPNPAKKCTISEYGDTMRSMVDDGVAKSIRMIMPDSLDGSYRSDIAQAFKQVKGQYLFKNTLMSLASFDPSTGNIVCEVQADFVLPDHFDPKEAKRLAESMGKSPAALPDDVLDPDGKFTVHIKLSDDPAKQKGNYEIVSSGDLSVPETYELFKVYLEAEEISKNRLRGTSKKPLSIDFY